MIDELEENRRGNVFTKTKMPSYCLIYILYKTLEQNIKANPDLYLLIEELRVTQEIKDILRANLQTLPEDFSAEDFERYSRKRIHSYFKSFRLSTLQQHEEMYSTPGMCRLVSKLLDLSESDRLADFYGAPESFLSELMNNPEINFTFNTKPVSYTSSKDARDFLLLYNDIIFPENRQIEICIKEDGIKNEKRLFNKIYSFIPLFKNSFSQTPNRMVKNYIDSQDDSLSCLTNVLNHLDKNGRAIICISDILYSEKNTELRKTICQCGFFKGLIRFPAGEVYPKNLVSTLLIFDKNNTEDKIIFLDLSSVMIPLKEKSLTEVFKDDEDIINHFLGLKHSDRYGVERNEVTCKDLEAKNFVFETTKPFDPIEFLVNYTKPFEELKNHAEIFRGLQDTAGIREAETSANTPYRYMSVSDIQDGEIEYENMTRLSEIKNSWNKYLLKTGDVLITKTSYPAFKVALFEDSSLAVIPASNLFVIRIRDQYKQIFNPCYLKLYLESTSGQKYLHSLTSGAKLPAISKENLEKMTIPGKPFEEQKEIERRYKKLQRLSWQYKKEIENAKKELLSIAENNKL